MRRRTGKARPPGMGKHRKARVQRFNAKHPDSNAKKLARKKAKLEAKHKKGARISDEAPQVSSSSS